MRQSGRQSDVLSINRAGSLCPAQHLQETELSYIEGATVVHKDGVQKIVGGDDLAEAYGNGWKFGNLRDANAVMESEPEPQPVKRGPGRPRKNGEA